MTYNPANEQMLSEEHRTKGHGTYLTCCPVCFNCRVADLLIEEGRSLLRFEIEHSLSPNEAGLVKEVKGR